MNSMVDRQARKPIGWTSIDKEIATAVVHANSLNRRWVDAQLLAREAQERIAVVSREGQRLRAEALAAGKPDPGAVELSTVEAEATAASDTADALGEGWLIAREHALAIADEHAARWQRDARQQLDRSTAKLLAALDAASTAYDEWRSDRSQVLLATSPETRARSQTKPMHAQITSPISTEPSVETLIDVLREAIEHAPTPGIAEVESAVDVDALVRT